MASSDESEPLPPAPPPKQSSQVPYGMGTCSPNFFPYGNLGWQGVGYGGFGQGPFSGNMYGYNPAFGGSYLENSMYGSGGFLERFEASGRPAFEMIGSIVNAFGSVSMLLESTHQSVFSIFKSVYLVVEQFKGLRRNFVGIISAFSFAKTLRWLQAFISKNDSAWNSSLESGDISDGSGKWLILAFTSVMIGLPWLVLKSMKSVSVQDQSKWRSGESEHFVGTAKFDFLARNEEELSLVKDQTIKIAPRQLQPPVRDWFLATVDGEKIGLVPANYVKLLGRKRGSKPNPDVVQ